MKFIFRCWWWCKLGIDTHHHHLDIKFHLSLRIPAHLWSSYHLFHANLKYGHCLHLFVISAKLFLICNLAKKNWTLLNPYLNFIQKCILERQTTPWSSAVILQYRFDMRTVSWTNGCRDTRRVERTWLEVSACIIFHQKSGSKDKFNSFDAKNVLSLFTV